MSKMKMFQIYDSKVEVWEIPHFFRTTSEALRAYSEEVNREDSKLCKYSADFTFFESGEIDLSNGSITQLPAKINLGTGLELKRTVAPTTLEVVK